MAEYTYKEMTARLTAQLLKREGRFSDHQVMMVRWDDLTEKGLRTRNGREVILSDVCKDALQMIPRRGSFIFLESPLEKERRQNADYIEESAEMKREHRQFEKNHDKPIVVKKRRILPFFG